MYATNQLSNHKHDLTTFVGSLSIFSLQIVFEYELRN